MSCAISSGLVSAWAEINSSATFNFTPYLATALLFVMITIPQARLTDWLVNRERRRRQAGTAL